MKEYTDSCTHGKKILASKHLRGTNWIQLILLLRNYNLRTMMERDGRIGWIEGFDEFSIITQFFGP